MEGVRRKEKEGGWSREGGVRWRMNHDKGGGKKN